MLKYRYFPESLFGGFTDIDGTIAFYLRVNALLEPHFVVADFGCGRGAYTDDPVPIRRRLRILTGKVDKVFGLDIDTRAEQNPYIDEFRIMESDNWPLENDSVDLCICDNVLEHIEKPHSFFSEAERVLRHKGYLAIRTPNKWNYVSLISRLIPYQYHAMLLAKVQDNRDESDVFPTAYKCNTTGRIRAMMSKHGFEHVVYGYEAEPSYLAFSRIAYQIGMLHQRFAPSYLRHTIFAFGQYRNNAARSVVH